MESWGEFEKLWNKAKLKNGCNPVRITNNYGTVIADAWSYHSSYLRLYRDGRIKAIMDLKIVKRVE